MVILYIVAAKNRLKPWISPTYLQNIQPAKTCDIRLRYLDYYDF